MHPHEGSNRSGVDAGAVKVAAGSSDDAADEQTENDASGLHDGGTKALAEDDGDEGEEAKTQVLGRAPRESVRGADVGAHRELGERVGVSAGAGTAGPVLEAGLDQADADEHNGGAGDNGREHAQHVLGRQEREQDFEQGADGSCAEDGSVTVGTRQTGAVFGDGAHAVGVHLVEATDGHGDDGEGDADDGDQTGAEVVGRLQDTEPDYLDHGQQAGDDEGARDEILGVFGGKVGASSSSNNDGGSDDAS